MSTKHWISRAAAVTLLLAAAACAAEPPRLPTDTTEPGQPVPGGEAYVAPAQQAPHA